MENREYKPRIIDKTIEPQAQILYHLIKSFKFSPSCANKYFFKIPLIGIQLLVE